MRLVGMGHSMRGIAQLLTVAVSAILLAGCTSAESAKTTTVSTTAAAPSVTEETGSISGVIMDEEIRGIPGAEVGVLDRTPELKTTTDAQGMFTFNELPAGDYKLVAQKLGYESRALSVTVEVGKVAEAKITLVAIAIKEEREFHFPFSGFFACGASSPALTVACRTTVDPNDKSSFKTNVTAADIMTVVDTMTWDSTAPGTAKIFRNILSIDGVAGSAIEKNGVSPNILRMDEPNAKKNAKLNHLIWIGWTSTGDPTQVVVVVYQQKFTTITSMFYGEEAPEDFSALPP